MNQDARKAFPCFDEPNLKAVYDFTIEHPADMYSLSNFPIKVNIQKYNLNQVLNTYYYNIPSKDNLSSSKQ